MAEPADSKPKKSKRRIKQVPTVREQTHQDANDAAKQNSKSQPKGVIRRLFNAIGGVIATVLRPFSFLLWPFKTKPARFIGRILAKILLINFMHSAWKELRLVQWPNRKQTAQLTSAVFIFAIVFGIIVSVADLALDKIFKAILLR